MKSNKKQQRTSELEKAKRARESQDEQRRHKKSKRKPGLRDIILSMLQQGFRIF